MLLDSGTPWFRWPFGTPMDGSHVPKSTHDVGECLMRLSNNEPYKAIRAGLTVGVRGLVGVAGAAISQDSEERTLHRLQATGSRIRQVDLETAQPVLTISREEIEAQGLTSVADILQSMTTAGTPPISRSSPLSSGEAVGGVYIDMRNLGPNRTLVLVNGKRL